MKTCFVISPIGPPDSDIRKRSDQILSYVIRPAMEDAGYQTVRADEMSSPGLITPQIIDHLIKDELVVADLTGKNPNVYYELALRHASKKPVINIRDPLEIIPFDVAGLRTIDVDYRFITSMDKCRNEIAKQIRSLERDPNSAVTPVSFTLALLSNKTGSSQGELNVQLMSSLQSIKAELELIKRHLGDQSNTREYLGGEAPSELGIDHKGLRDLAKIFSQFEGGPAKGATKGRKKKT